MPDQTRTPSAQNIQVLCEALRSEWYLTPGQIDAILANRDFFQPYLREALEKRAKIARVPFFERPIDPTDCQAIFFLTEWGDECIIPDVIKCLGMKEEHLDLLYGDSLTEHMWLPFAKLGHNALEEIWEFVTNTKAYVFARDAAVTGVVSLHHFHPDHRATSVAFVERLLSRTDVFPVDHLAGVLCDSADSGLTELHDRALEFAEHMKNNRGPKWSVPSYGSVSELLIKNPISVFPHRDGVLKKDESLIPPER